MNKTRQTFASLAGEQPPAVIHVDLDGAADIYKSHGWDYPYADDPLFETGVQNILALFERNAIRASFFVIANSLDHPRKRELIQQAMRHGHEIASHSLTHTNLLHLKTEQKRHEIAGSREKIEAILSVPVRGFRAPGYQIDRECVELLAESGYRYDASVFPTGAYARRLECPVETLSVPHRPLHGKPLWELPLLDHRPSPFPFNPSYSLLFGARYFRWGLERFRRRGIPLVFLFHLTDVADPMPPERLNGWRSRILTLSNLSQEKKLSGCRRMLNLVSQRFRITTTRALIDECSNLVPLDPRAPSSNAN